MIGEFLKNLFKPKKRFIEESDIIEVEGFHLKVGEFTAKPSGLGGVKMVIKTTQVPKTKGAYKIDINRFVTFKFGVGIFNLLVRDTKIIANGKNGYIVEVDDEYDQEIQIKLIKENKNERKRIKSK
jgi:hypothetical protein